jgi:hypothetical protein
MYVEKSKRPIIWNGGSIKQSVLYVDVDTCLAIVVSLGLRSSLHGLVWN